MLLDEAERMALKYMEQHGLLPEWSFKYDGARNRFGRCVYTTRTISLSRHLVGLNSVDEVRDTVLHEIAHALVGPGHGHNLTWKYKCVEVGAKPERCFDGESVATPQYRWLGICTDTTCGKEYHRHRLKQAARRGLCNRCRSAISWVETGATVQTVEFVDELPA